MNDVDLEVDGLKLDNQMIDAAIATREQRDGVRKKCGITGAIITSRPPSK